MTKEIPGYMVKQGTSPACDRICAAIGAHRGAALWHLTGEQVKTLILLAPEKIQVLKYSWMP